MKSLAAKSPVMRDEFLMMADAWTRMEEDSAKIECPPIKPDAV